MINKEINIENPIPQRKVYKDKMIWLGAFLGGPLVAGYIIAENFKTFNNPTMVKRTWFFTILATILIFAIVFLIPENAKGFERIIPITYTAIAALLLQHFQGKQILLHIKSGGCVYSWWKVVVIGLIGLIITLGAIIGGIFISDAISTANMTS